MSQVLAVLSSRRLETAKYNSIFAQKCGAGVKKKGLAVEDQCKASG